jgi:hypothetical protein
MNIKKITTKTALVIATSAMMSSSVFAACSADIDMGGQKITNMATPTVALGAANKGYVDSKASPFPVFSANCAIGSPAVFTGLKTGIYSVLTPVSGWNGGLWAQSHNDGNSSVLLKARSDGSGMVKGSNEETNKPNLEWSVKNLTQNSLW